MSTHKNPLVFSIVSTDLLYPDFVLTSCPCGFDLTTARGVMFCSYPRDAEQPGQATPLYGSFFCHAALIRVSGQWLLMYNVISQLYGRLCDIMKNGDSPVKNSHLTRHLFYALQRV